MRLGQARRMELVRAICLSLASAGASAQAPQARLSDLSLEELGNVEITSVSKLPERLAEAAAAVFVITAEDIRRAGAASLPEALRLAPNLQVAQVDASAYAISARGFNINTANKLLVLIDGRSVYTPLHAGVFWDTPDVLLEDIERVEVISGPGGTLWGSNAVNGVINITTRRASASAGGLLRLSGGTRDRASGGARFGGRLSDHTAFRVYGKHLERGASLHRNGTAAEDAWHKSQGGFRVDWEREGDAATLQGDAYQGRLDQPGSLDRTIQGQNLVGRLGRIWSKDAELQIQFYFDRTKREYPGIYGEDRNTVDVDLQHRFKLGERQEVVWGGGFRSYRDRIQNSGLLAFLPADTDHRLSNLFVQDRVGFLGGRLTLTLGVKAERNDYTGYEVQPNGRLGLKVNDHQFLWAAISRAARTPSRVDRDLYAPPNPPYLIAGGPRFRSEALTAYEFGYRGRAGGRVSIVASAFYNDYAHLRSVELGPSGAYTVSNQMEGHTLGAEVWCEVAATGTWRVQTGYAYLQEDLRLLPGSTDPSGTRGAGNDPRHRASLRSLWDLGPNWELDCLVRHVASLPNPPVPAYTAVDVHLGWRPMRGLELALVGQNLTDARHVEFTPSAAAVPSVMERGARVKLTWTF
ncbi:MAG: TonB-dependent receptor [Acidobacteria bacterium]|nr:TonB-dependent receptor [Acidobacteriota bacterium]